MAAACSYVRNVRPTVLAAALIWTATLGIAQAADRRPIVVELFTAQGCSSCPPADALLNELAQTRRDVLPLSFHVDYWDRFGWKDPYSSVEATERQRVYAGRSSDPTLFTPQMIVDGTQAIIGSDADAINTALETAENDVVTLASVSLKVASGEAVIAVGAGTGAADVVLVSYDRTHTTPVGRGENTGRTLTEAQIVRSIESVGSWTGTPLTLRRKRPPGQLLAVLLTAPDGRVVGAAAPGR